MADNEIYIAQLLSDALKATLAADAEAANYYLDTIKDHAFRTGVNELDIKSNELKTVSFNYYNQEGQRQVVTIPELSLMPLPLLHVTEASFEMDTALVMKTDSVTMSGADDSPGSTVTPLPTRRLKASDIKSRLIRNVSQTAMVKVQLPSKKGSVQSANSNSTTTNMKIKVQLGQSDLPAGLTNLLQIVANTVQVNPAVPCDSENTKE